MVHKWDNGDNFAWERCDSVPVGVFFTVLSNVVSTGEGVILGAMEGCTCGSMTTLDSDTV